MPAPPRRVGAGVVGAEKGSAGTGPVIGTVGLLAEYGPGCDHGLALYPDGA